MHGLILNIYSRFIEPRSFNPDARRRECILNILLVGLISLGALAVVVTIINYVVIQELRYLPNVLSAVAFTLVLSALLIASRRISFRLTSQLFVIFLLTGSTLFALQWSVRLAAVQLAYAMVIVIAGVLFNALGAVKATLATTACLFIIGTFQVFGWQKPYIAWESDPVQLADIIGYIFFFALIGVVSWLSSSETDRALQRALHSEAVLQKERDSLEIKVAERTRQLEDLQAARLLEIQPFAEFGRIGASLVHDIANPLTAATLHLEELDRQQHSELVLQVQRNLHYLEKYLIAARKQIRRESDLRSFNAGAEIRQVTKLLTHRANRAGVMFKLNIASGVRLYGDAAKFNQIVANLLANAIDASENSDDPTVILKCSGNNEGIEIIVTDHGNGITQDQAEHLFEPFYSTKGNERSGFGMGLAMVKQYIENDFIGSIAVNSSLESGTTFTAILKSSDR